MLYMYNFTVEGHYQIPSTVIHSEFLVESHKTDQLVQFEANLKEKFDYVNTFQQKSSNC
jgi:hypothetical protein